jgi:Mlc titration factor MtfA (ptsG expression regulator)
MAVRIPKKWLYLADGLVLVIAFCLVLFGITHTNTSKDNAVCQKAGKENQLTLRDDRFSPNKLTLRQCDTIKIVNLDTRTFSLAFGTHESHIAYPGFSEQVIRPNEFIVIDAVQAGSYLMHDHLRDQAQVNLTITPID